MAKMNLKSLTSSGKYFIRRGIFLYSVLAVILLTSVDYEKAYINHLNLLKNIEYYLYDFLGGVERYDEESFKQGVRYYKEFLKENRTISSGYGSLGLCYFYLGDYSRAISNYQKAIHYEQNYYIYHWDLGMIHFCNENYAEATEHLQKAVDLIPQAVGYYLKLGEQLQVAGKPDQSKTIYYLMHRAKRDEVQAYEQLALCYFLIREYIIMREISIIGLQNDSTNPKLLYYAGVANVMMKKYQAGLLYFTKLLSLDPEFAQAKFYHELCLSKTRQMHISDSDLKNIAAADVTEQLQGFSCKKLELHLGSDIQALRIQLVQ